jgi:hypothetical protein
MIARVRADSCEMASSTGMNEGRMTDELGTIAQEAYIYLYP